MNHYPIYPNTKSKLPNAVIESRNFMNVNLNIPLAHRVRPKTLDEFVGQEEILGQDKILYRTIKADRLSSIILWGPPGSRENITCKSN